MPNSPLSPLLPLPSPPSAELETQMRVRQGTLKLDAALAAGANPESNGDLELRARQLATRRKRTEMADAISELLVFDRCGGARIPMTKSPLSRHRVQANRAQLEEIVRVLKAEQIAPVEGLAMVHLLLEDAGSALYAHELSGVALEPALGAIISAIQPD